MHLTFENPDAAFWLISALVAIALLSYAAARRRRSFAGLATHNLHSRFRNAVGPTRRTGRGLLLIGAICLLSLALMDPRAGSRYEQVAQRNIDIVFMLDTSRSMLAEDLRPNRLERAKGYIRDVVEHAVGDRRARRELFGAGQRRNLRPLDRRVGRAREGQHTQRS